MIGPSQAAGWDDWFDYNENSPLVNYYRDYFRGEGEDPGGAGGQGPGDAAA